MPATPMDLATYVSTYGPQPVVVVCQGDGGRMLPDADGGVATITFASLESAAGRAAAARFAARADGDPAAQYEALVELLAGLVTKWTLPLPCDGEVARVVLREIGWLTDTAFAALQGDAAFFGRSGSS